MCASPICRVQLPTEPMILNEQINERYKGFGELLARELFYHICKWQVLGEAVSMTPALLPYLVKEKGREQRSCHTPRESQWPTL